MKFPSFASHGAPQTITPITLALIAVGVLSACTDSADSTAVSVPVTTVIVTQPIAQPSSPAKSATPSVPGQPIGQPAGQPDTKKPAAPTPVSEQPAAPTKNKEPVTRAPVTATPSSPIAPVTAPAPQVPAPQAPAPQVTTPQASSDPVQATEASLNHYCLLSDHSNLCSRTSMYSDWPGHSLKLEPINNTNRTLTGTLVIEYDGSKIEPGVDGYLRSSVHQGKIAFEKSPNTLTIRNFNIYPGRNYHYIWSRLKKDVQGTVFGKASFSWRQDNQTKYITGCYEFKTGSQSGGNDNIQGIEKGRFNAYGGMDCGKPNIPE
jgi:hypothetical protein